MRSKLFALAVVLVTVPVAAGEFPLKDGDIWVMAGDSITAQHLHSNYFEAFCFARYPKLKFAFRNSGVGGHTIPSTLARYDYDINAWNPTVVSVELGMNDQGGNTPEQYIANMTTMVERIRSAKARPVMFTASPINSGDTMAALGRNARLNDYAVKLKEFSEKEKLPFADQFHLLIDIWGKNKPREVLANMLPPLLALSKDDNLAGVEQLRGFLAAQEKASPKLVSMQGDPVHPGPPGQLMMAAALLKELGAEPFVSSAAFDSTGKVLEAKGCKIDDAKSTGESLIFTRTDECLPFPIPEEAAMVLPTFPAFAELSQYLLTVKGLAPGTYLIKVNDAALPVAVSEKDLDRGVNLTILANTQPGTPNAIALQGRAVLSAVALKEGLVSGWRGLSQRAHAAGAPTELKQQLAEATKRVEAADEKIREAAKPQALRFEVTPKK